MAISFVHLRVHSEFSLIDGTLRLNELIEQSRAMSMPAVALTDETNLFALVKFYKAAIRAGIKPIIGSDFWLANAQDETHPYRLTLLAMNAEGYHNLIKLITLAWRQGQRQSRPLLNKEWVFEANQGLIVLAGGKDGEIGRFLLADHTELAETLLTQWLRFFADRFYLEINRTQRQYDEECLQRIVKLAIKTQTPVVATNDVRFLHADDYWAHETRVAINEGRTLDDPRREQRFCDAQYLKSAQEMQHLFADLPQALANSVLIAARCNVEVPLGKYFLPEFPIPPQLTLEVFLLQEAQQGLTKRLKQLFDGEQAIYQNRSLAAAEPHYQQRLIYELDIINKMGFAGYFLIVMDFIRWAKDHQIPVGPGRGSGAGSLVAYALGITDLDPIEYDLLFERFLNPERVSMPDFDIDFCMEKRDRVIEYVAERYGRDAVSQIVTFGTMAAKAVVRDVARAQGKPYALGDKLSKLIPFELGITLAKAYQQEPALKDFLSQDEEANEIWEMALKLEGLTRNTGKHAGGVVIAPTQLIDFAPLLCDADGQNLVVQFDKNDVEEAGLVKFDFLGLRTLTIIDWALQIINVQRMRQHLPALDLQALPLDDAATFALLQSGETTAVFQLESRGMKELIKRLQPDSLEDMIALVALFRPGPLQSGMVDDFINRKHRRAAIAYPHPHYQHALLKPVLESTYGIILYQEQVMQIAQVLAGFTLGQADMLRRAMGKKKPEEMAKQRQSFLDGCVANGIAIDLASNLFELVEKFAGYGFNKSHSAAYGLVSYQTAWLKTHYAAPFMAAVLSTEMDNIDKIVPLIEECRRMGLTILPPDVNQGDYRFTVNDANEIIYGLGAIRGVGEGPVEAIVTARQEGQSFVDLFDFCQRITNKRLNRRTLEALIRSGALDSLGSREQMMVALDDALKAAIQAITNQSLGIHDMFGDALVPVTQQDVYRQYQDVLPWLDRDRLAGERETLGLYLTGHPLNEYRAELQHYQLTTIHDLKPSKELQRIAGIITSYRTMRSKRGDLMAFVTLDDRSGRLEAVLYRELFEPLREQLGQADVYIIEGEVGYDDFTSSLRMRVKKISSLNEMRLQFAKAVKFTLKQTDEQGLQQLIQCLQSFRTNQQGLPVHIHYQNATAGGTLALGPQWRMMPSDQLLAQLTHLAVTQEVSLQYS